MPHWTGKNYFATLAIRASEMNGLEYLPGSSKDVLVPVVLLAPWVASRTLEQAIERFERAYPSRPYILDIDRDYFPTNPQHGAQARWLSLRNPANNFRNWNLFWQGFSQIIPCLQLEGQASADIRAQVEMIQAADREFCYRIDLSRRSHDISLVTSALVECGTADFSVIVEGGWTNDAMTLASIFSGLINGPLARLDGRVPIIISCTSMRREFTSIDGIASDQFTNRELVGKIRSNTNRQQIIYGDWGSTKPRDNTMGRTPLPRIDYPCDQKWLLARSRSRDWSYAQAALAVTSTDDWDGNLGIWGEDLIRATANNDEFAINSPAKNVAARVNIHLHRQAHFGDNIHGIILDEPWID